MADDNKIIAELIVTGTQKFKEELASTSVATDTLKKDVKDVGVEGSKSFTLLGNEAESAGNEIEKTNQKTSSYKTQLKQMRSEVITLTLELNKMKDAGKQGTKEFTDLDTKIKTLTNDAGRLDDVIRDVSGTVKNAGSDTRGLDMTIRKVQTVAAGFQLAQGAAALFGGENKELSNALIKLNGIMAVTSALQQIQNEYLKEDSVLTGVATVAKRAYAGAVAFATGALSLFRTALVGLGIGAFIAGIALLVENWDKLKLAIAGATGSLERLAAQREKDAQLAKESIKDLDTELKYKIAIGESTEKTALTEKITKETEVRKKLFEQYKAEKKILTELEGQKFATVFGVEIGEKSTRKELEAQRKKVKEVDLEFMKYTISIDGARKQLTELNKVKIDKPIKEATKAIKELTEIIFTKVDFKFPDEAIQNIFTDLQAQINVASQELVAEFSINPKSDSLEPLSARLRDLTRQLEIVKAKYEQVVNPKPPETLESIANTANVPELPNNEQDPAKPKTLWERIFGTKEENDAKQKELDERIQLAQYVISQINDIAGGIGDVATQAIQLRANAEVKALEDKKNKGLISEKQYEKESAAIKNEAAKKQRKFDIAMAVAKIPLVVLNALATAPNAIVGAVLAALAGGLALAQVAILASSPLPQFKEGGLTDRIFKGSGKVVGKSHERGGVNAELEGNEFVMKEKAVKTYGVKMMDDINNLKFKPIINYKDKPKRDRNYALNENLATIGSYLRQGNKFDSQGNLILKEISQKLKPRNPNV